MGTRCIIAVRHAPVSHEFAGRCYGVTDAASRTPHLDAAERVQEMLRDGDVSVERVWSSDLQRCAGLALALSCKVNAARGERGGMQHIVDQRLRELDHGEFEGRYWDEIHREHPEAFAAWGERWIAEGPPRGESALELTRRVGEWFRSLPPSGTEVLIAHAGVMRALAVLSGDGSWEDAMAMELPHLGLRRFTFDDPQSLRAT